MTATDYDTPELVDVLEEAISSRLLDVHVALPARVVSYDAAQQTVSVELGVHRVLETDEGEPVAEKLPILQNVPVSFHRVASGFLSLPIAADDPGLVIFCESSIDQWRAKGTPTPPGDRRRHSLTGGVFVPGLTPNGEELTDPGLATAVAVGETGGAQVRITGGEVRATSGGAADASDFVALAQAVLDRLQDLSDRIAVFERVFAAWTPVAMDGGAALKTAYGADPGTPGPAPSSVASSNLKAD